MQSLPWKAQVLPAPVHLRGDGSDAAHAGHLDPSGAARKLGADPFEPHANVLAGAAYLREMLDRYGDLSAALAAYNAGPRRVDAWRRRGASLPAETLSYVARLSLRLGLAGACGVPLAVPSTADRAARRPVDWRASSLFGTPVRGDQENAALVSDTLSQPVIPLPGTWPSALFVPVSQVGKP
jgi:hypothetical protein